MHRAPGPWNTGVTHGSSTESPASLSLLSYKGLVRVSEGLSRGTHCCSRRRDHAESQCVAWTAGGPGFNHGHAVHELGAVCHSPATLGSCESCFAKQRPQEWARHPSTAHEATLCSWPPPSSGRGKSLSGCRAFLPHP